VKQKSQSSQAGCWPKFLTEKDEKEGMHRDLKVSEK
jgi:hypothetical protein